SFDRLIPNFRGPLVVPMLRTSDRDTPKPRPTARMAVLLLLLRRQSGSFPSFEPAGHGADVFVAHFLQTLSGQRRTAASAAMANDRCVHIGNFFFDIELKSAATQVNRAGNMLFVPFVFLADIDNHRPAAL